jgi:two-component system, NarL family, nitrate/nitrite response regulator NarL
MDQIRILIVDDHSLFRQSLGRFLATTPGCCVVGQCGSTAEAVRAFSETEADLVLLDFDLGDGQGVDLIAELKKRQESAKVLMVTAGMPDGSAVRVMEAGASGIFLKHGTLEGLQKAVECVAAGDIWLDSDEVRAIVTSSMTRRGISDRAQPLTARQSEVMRGILDGLTNKEIAVAINASESSVKAVIQELFRKAGVRTRSQLVRIAIEKHSSDWLQPQPAESAARS